MIERILSLLKSLIDSVNAVSMQVWSIVILALGALLALKQHDTGSMVIGGALALLQHKSEQK